MHRKINIGFVGAGYWGRKLLPKFLALSDLVSVRVVCDLHDDNRMWLENNIAGIPTVASLAAMLEGFDIDTVVLVTPPATHYALGKMILSAGKHLWMEKPLALTLIEGRELVRLADETQRVLFVDHTFLYDSALTIARDWIRSGKLGQIYHLYLQRLNLGRIKRDSNVWWNSAPHDASILLHLLSSPPSTVTLHGYSYLQPDLQDLNMAVVEMADGSSVFIYHSWLFPENTARLTVIGSRGFLVYEGKFDRRSLSVYEYELDLPRHPAGHSYELPTTIPSRIVSQESLDGFQKQEPLASAVEDFLTSIRYGTTSLSDGAFALQVLGILEAGERSQRAHGVRTAVEL